VVAVMLQGLQELIPKSTPRKEMRKEISTLLRFGRFAHFPMQTGAKELLGSGPKANPG
jgi:hypothetical protein